MPQKQKDYYTILGLAPTVGPADIKSAYRRLALQWHPDRNPGNPLAERHFKELAEAYHVLGDPSRRGRYDNRDAPPLRETRARRSPEKDVRTQIDELFDYIKTGSFRRHRPGAVPRKGEDLRYPITVDFSAAVFGTEREIAFTAHRLCATCQGSGARPGSPLTPCPVCFGLGKTSTGGSHSPCESCHGLGVLAVDRCPACKGKASLPVRHRMTLRIPPGCETGTRLRVPGEGEPGLYGGPPGDLYVVVAVTEHPLFHRQGYDIVCELPLTYGQASLGAELDAPTVDGPHPVRIKPGTQHGEIITLPGRGVPRGENGKDRGDHKFVAMIEVPRRLSSRQKELLRQFDAILMEQKESAVGRFWQQVRNLFG